MFEVVYEPEAAQEIRALRSFDRARIVDAIEGHLSNNPTQLGGAKKKIVRDDDNSVFQLRVGDFRVFYDVDEEKQLSIVRHVRRKGRKTTGDVL